MGSTTKYRCKDCNLQMVYAAPKSLVTGLDKVRCGKCGQIGSWILSS